MKIFTNANSTAIPRMDSVVLTFTTGDGVTILDGLYRQSCELVLYQGIVSGIKYNVELEQFEYEVAYRMKDSELTVFKWTPCTFGFDSVQSAVSYYLAQIFTE